MEEEEDGAAQAQPEPDLARPETPAAAQTQAQQEAAAAAHGTGIHCACLSRTVLQPFGEQHLTSILSHLYPASDNRRAAHQSLVCMMCAGEPAVKLGPMHRFLSAKRPVPADAERPQLQQGRTEAATEVRSSKCPPLQLCPASTTNTMCKK